MSPNTDKTFRTLAAQLVAKGKHITLLVNEPVLGERRACRMRLAIEGAMYSGLGLSLNLETCLFVVDAPALAQSYDIGSTLALSHVRPLGGELGFEHLRGRLLALVDGAPLESLSDRATRHALLYILEARDPLVRCQRLEILKAALGRKRSLR